MVSKTTAAAPAASTSTTPPQESETTPSENDDEYQQLVRKVSQGVANSTQGVEMDPKDLEIMYDECCGLFHSHKITPLNAFNLKLIECFDEVIKMESLDRNNMQKVGRALEVGTKIYSCRVEYTHNIVYNLAQNVSDKDQLNKQKKRGGEDDPDEEGAEPSANRGHGSDDDDLMEMSVAEEEMFEEFEGGRIPVATFWNDKDENKNVGAETQFDMEDCSVEDNGELRRLRMKESFDSFSISSKKFDFASEIFGKTHMEEKRRAQVPRNLNKLNFLNPVSVNTSAMAQMSIVPFLRFAKGTYDPDNYDIWGNPLNAIGVNSNESCRAAMLVKRAQLKKRLSETFEDALRELGLSQSVFGGFSERVPSCEDGPPLDVMQSVHEHDINGNGHDDHMDMDNLENVNPMDDGMSAPMSEPDHLDPEDNVLEQSFNPIGDDGKLRELNINEVNSLDVVDMYYDAMQKIKDGNMSNFMGWAGPRFVRTRRPKTAKSGPRRKKGEQDPIDLLNMDFELPDNQYIRATAAATQLDEATIGKWAAAIPKVPYMVGCEGEEEDDEEFLNDAFEGRLTVGNATVDQMFKLFVDYDRDIYAGAPREQESRPQTAVVLNGDAGEAQNGIGGGDHDGHFDDDGHIDFGGPVGFEGDEPPLDMEGIRQLGEEVETLGRNAEFVEDGDLDIMRRHKMIPSNLAGFEFGSEAEEYPLSHFADTDSLKFARRPKPINISKVKECITQILKEHLCLDEKGSPTKEERTETNILRLMTDMIRRLDDHTIQFLTVSITLVAALHVVVDMKLFVDSGVLGSISNPTIICHGTKWQHKDHIPGISPNSRRPHTQGLSDGEVSQPKKKRAQREVAAAGALGRSTLADLSDSENDEPEVSSAEEFMDAQE